MYGHYVAHARGNLLPLADTERSRWLWRRARALFPDALSVMLMPDHPHIVAPIRTGGRRSLASLLGAFARRFELGDVWETVPEPQELTSPDKLQRTVRYGLLNPCRPWRWAQQSIRLVSDPLLWPWSTLRDVVGAVADPWVSAERLRRALGWDAPDFPRRFHRYVSHDEHVSPGGAAFPERAPPSSLPSCRLEELEHAVLAAARAPVEALRHKSPARKIYVCLARRQGWPSGRALAETCGVHRNALARLAGICPADWVEAAALCLGDRRLQVVELEFVQTLAVQAPRALVRPATRAVASFPVERIAEP